MFFGAVPRGAARSCGSTPWLGLQCCWVAEGTPHPLPRPAASGVLEEHLYLLSLLEYLFLLPGMLIFHLEWGHKGRGLGLVLVGPRSPLRTPSALCTAFWRHRDLLGEQGWPMGGEAQVTGLWLGCSSDSDAVCAKHCKVCGFGQSAFLDLPVLNGSR